VRAPRDYDGEATDEDRYELTFPAAATDRAWSLYWEVDKVGGNMPGELVVGVEFCSDSGCSPPATGQLGIYYQPNAITGWWQANPNQVMFDDRDHLRGGSRQLRPDDLSRAHRACPLPAELHPVRQHARDLPGLHRRWAQLPVH
jgi:hypothetical protein